MPDTVTAVAPIFSARLPMPPSTNSLHRNLTAKERRNPYQKRGKLKTRIKSKGYREWITAASWKLATAMQHYGITDPYPRRVGLVIEVDRTSPLRDIDNCLKATLDLLNGKAYVDDRYVSAIHTCWRPKKTKDPEVRIFVFRACDMPAVHFQINNDCPWDGGTFVTS